MKIINVARRLRKTSESDSILIPRETVVCGKCGQRFAIQSDQAIENTELAGKQAAWVADQLVWDHIQERKHHGTIELPSM